MGQRVPHAWQHTPRVWQRRMAEEGGPCVAEEGGSCVCMPPVRQKRRSPLVQQRLARQGFQHCERLLRCWRRGGSPSCCERRG